MIAIVDAQLPPVLAVFLRSQGHEAHHVAELGMLAASDGDIWAAALHRGAAIVTKDRDFPDRARVSAQAPQIVWIRIGNTTRLKLLTRFAAALPALIQRLNDGDGVIELR